MAKWERARTRQAAATRSESEHGPKRWRSRAGVAWWLRTQLLYERVLRPHHFRNIKEVEKSLRSLPDMLAKHWRWRGRRRGQ